MWVVLSLTVDAIRVQLLLFIYSLIENASKHEIYDSNINGFINIGITYKFI